MSAGPAVGVDAVDGLSLTAVANPVQWIDIGVILLLAMVGLATVLFSFLVWRTGYRQGFTAARRQPPLCPQCGYDLSGQTVCRCPECGTQYRLDELWRSASYTPAQNDGADSRNNDH